MKTSIKERKRVLVIICLVFTLFSMFFSASILAAKYDVDYESYYEMAGGLFTRSSLVSKGRDICIAIAPEKGTSGCSMGIRLQKYDNDKWNYVRSEKYVDSVYGGNVRFNNVSKGKYRIYLRNYSNTSSGSKGRKWVGDILVEFK